MKEWWNNLDMNDKYLIHLYSGMFGSVEQRIEQLYIIRNSFNFKKK